MTDAAAATDALTEGPSPGRTVVHGSFTLERTYPHAPATVFAAWASKDVKASWWGPDFVDRLDGYELDFRVGGREHFSGGLRSGRTFTYDATYMDIVEDHRIVATYDLRIDGRRISVTLLTVELEPAGTGTRLVLTEHAAFLDGLDGLEDRRPGVEAMLDQLNRYMATVAAAWRAAAPGEGRRRQRRPVS